MALKENTAASSAQNANMSAQSAVSGQLKQIHQQLGSITSKLELLEEGFKSSQWQLQNSQNVMTQSISDLVDKRVPSHLATHLAALTTLLGEHKSHLDTHQKESSTKLAHLEAQVHRQSLFLAFIAFSVTIITISALVMVYPTVEKHIRTTALELPSEFPIDFGSNKTVVTDPEMLSTDPTDAKPDPVEPGCELEMNFYLHNHTSMSKPALKENLIQLFRSGVRAHPNLSKLPEKCINVQWKSRNLCQDLNGFAVFTVVDSQRGYILNRDFDAADRAKERLIVPHLLALALRYEPGTSVPTDYYTAPKWSNEGYAELLFDNVGLVTTESGIARNNQQMATLLDSAYRNHQARVSKEDT